MKQIRKIRFLQLVKEIGDLGTVSRRDYKKDTDASKERGRRRSQAARSCRALLRCLPPIEEDLP